LNPARVGKNIIAFKWIEVWGEFYFYIAFEKKGTKYVNTMFNEHWKLVWVLQLKSKHTLVLFMFQLKLKELKKYLYFVNIFFHLNSCINNPQFDIENSKVSFISWILLQCTVWHFPLFYNNKLHIKMRIE